VAKPFDSDPEEFWTERLDALKRAAAREHAYQTDKGRQEDV
jgi:hypothetical protein